MLHRPLQTSYRVAVVVRAAYDVVRKSTRTAQSVVKLLSPFLSPAGAEGADETVLNFIWLLHISHWQCRGRTWVEFRSSPGGTVVR